MTTNILLAQICDKHYEMVLHKKNDNSIVIKYMTVTHRSPSLPFINFLFSSSSVLIKYLMRLEMKYIN